MSSYENASESSVDETYASIDSGYSLPASEMDPDEHGEIQEYWQPFIKLKLDIQGNVLLEGSSIEFHRYQNDTLICIQIHQDVLFIPENVPISEASSWWSFHIQNTIEQEDRNSSDCITEEIITEEIGFHFGIGEIQMESLAVWDSIHWEGLEVLHPSEIEYSAFLEIEEGQYWTYGIAIQSNQWLLLLPSYRFSL